MNGLEWEPLVRLGSFAAILMLMAGWEVYAPRRRLTGQKPRRWFGNLGLVLLNTVVVRAALPLGVVGVAVFAKERSWGLLNNVVLPKGVAVVLAVVALDLAIYLQHVMFHAVPLFWRLHMVHHADRDFDVSTGVRFHTLEILLSVGIKAAAVLLLGAPVLGVLIFEILLSATSLFNHGNVRLPAALDRLLRLLVVTPEMHRVHHSVEVAETNSNFGFNLPWWDHLFGTYRAQPAAGHEAMHIGLTPFGGDRVERLGWMLALPFRGEIGGYSVHRSNEPVSAEEARDHEG
ncbi:MAG: sterol desaturase family protein [Gemmataceae bacterium]|nr:sterol desaturase family protein [Gemmataceae bacterium]